MKKIKIEDRIPEFIPKNHEIRCVILGTMGSADARWIDGKDPGDVYFYHNIRNNFWKVLSWVIHQKDISNREVSWRQSFLEENGIAMCNLVQEFMADKEDSANPADDLLFQALYNDELKVKTISPELKRLLQTEKVFFTCLKKKGIVDLLKEFYRYNGLDEKLIDHIIFLPSPTRCSPQGRSLRWVELGL